jgi:hypothetical protein
VEVVVEVGEVVDGVFAHSAAGTAFPMAANSLSSDPAANFTASQGFEPFVPLATAA